MRVLQARPFSNLVKRFHGNQKADMDKAVATLMANPSLGEMKVGDLAGVRVYKFKLAGQLLLLAYMWREEENTLILLAAGPHENFYRELKRYLDAW